MPQNDFLEAKLCANCFCNLFRSIYCCQRSTLVFYALNYILWIHFLVVIVECRPLVQDSLDSASGYIKYTVENSTFEELSRKAFMSLQSEAVMDPASLTTEQKKAKWLQRKIRKQFKSEKRGKKILSSPRDALEHMKLGVVNLGNADALIKSTHCEGQLFKQRIRMEGCLSKIVINRFCHGACSSYFIPRLKPRKLKMKALFQSCSACQPSEYDTIEVKLDCPRKNPKELIRRVIKVKKCSCMALDMNNNYNV